MKLFFVHSLTQASPNLWEFGVPVDGLMLSADNLLCSRACRVQLRSAFNGPIILDSGGFRFLSRGVESNWLRVLEVQRRAGADLPVALDYPLKLGMSDLESRKRIRRTIATAVAWQSVFGESFIVVIHGFTLAQLNYAHTVAREYLGDVRYVAVGSIAPLSRYYTRKALELISHVRKLFSDSYLHALGCGNSLAAILAALGVDSADSASHLKDARFGMVRHPRTLEMCVVTARKVRGRPRIAPTDLFDECACPACRRRDPRIASWSREGFMLRAIHNAWMLAQMVRQQLVHRRFRGLMTLVR